MNNQLVGVLALQGNFSAHVRLFKLLGVDAQLVKHPSEIDEISALVIPGGESTTMLKFFEEYPFVAAIKRLHKRGGTIMGTCAGAILLAKEVEPVQDSLGLMNISVIRNAYGRQLSSCIREGLFVEQNNSVECIFIRAPKINGFKDSVKVIVRCGEDVVCVEENRCLVATFHPELSSDTRLHQHFLAMSALSS